MDLTDSAADEAVDEAVARSRAVHARSPLPVIEVDLTGTIAFANPAVAAMVGTTVDSLVGSPASSLLHDDDTVGRQMVAHTLSAPPGDLTEWGRVFRHAEGHQIHVRARTAMVHDSSGTPVGVLGVFWDVSRQKEVEEDLRAAVERATVLWEHAPVGVIEGTPEGEITFVNPQMATMLQREAADLIGTQAAALADPTFSAEIARSVEDLRRGSTYMAERRYLRGDGTPFPVLVSTAVLHDADGEVNRLAGFVVDVSDMEAQRAALRAAEQEASAANAFHAALLAASPDATVITDLATGEETYASRSLQQLLDVDSAAPVQIAEGDRSTLRTAMDRARTLADGEVVEVRYCIDTEGDGCRWVLHRLTPFARDDTGAVSELMGVVRDVTESVEAEERTARALMHDHLTGLPGRALLQDRLSRAYARAARADGELAVLFVDLDGFKRVNDTMGHAAGDEVLRQVALRLRALVRAADTVARVGGDEFVVVMEPDDHRPDVGSHRDQVLLSAERLRQAVAEPILLDGRRLQVTASIGVTFDRVHDAGRSGGQEGSETILRKADAAMYRAKSLGKDRHVVFEDGLGSDLTGRMQTEQHLRAALTGRRDADGPADRGADGPQLSAVFQPVFNASDGRLVSFEALARLHDEAGTLLDTDAVIGVAEDTGLVGHIGAFVLERACAQLSDWRRRGALPSDVTVAVNLSARQVHDPDLLTDVLGTIRTHGISPQDLVLELTETVLLEAGRSALDTLGRLRDAGVGVVIDDFGSGYGSLRYLATLPVSGVKVDRSFTLAIPHDPTSTKIVRAVIGLADDLGLTCTVEGIEDAQQLAMMPPTVMLQGFMLARPSPPAELDLDGLAQPTAARRSAPA